MRIIVSLGLLTKDELKEIFEEWKEFEEIYYLMN